MNSRADSELWKVLGLQKSDIVMPFGLEGLPDSGIMHDSTRISYAILVKHRIQGCPVIRLLDEFQVSLVLPLAKDKSAIHGMDKAFSISFLWSSMLCILRPKKILDLDGDVKDE